MCCWGGDNRVRVRVVFARSGDATAVLNGSLSDGISCCCRCCRMRMCSWYSGRGGVRGGVWSVVGSSESRDGPFAGLFPACVLCGLNCTPVPPGALKQPRLGTESEVLVMETERRCNMKNV